jgi:hypothetical protein
VPTTISRNFGHFRIYDQQNERLVKAHFTPSAKIHIEHIMGLTLGVLGPKVDIPSHTEGFAHLDTDPHLFFRQRRVLPLVMSNILYIIDIDAP